MPPAVRTSGFSARMAGTAVYKLSDETPFTPEPFNPPGTSGSCFIDLLNPYR